MFDFLIKKAPSAKAAAAAAATSCAPKELSPEQQVAQQAILERQKKSDPLIGPKMGARQINNSLITGMRTPKGVHIESYLTALGALAGYSCQMSVREVTKASGISMDENHVLVVADGADGKRYFFGDALNKPLAGDPHSVWSLAASAAQKMGGKLPDIGELFKHVSATVGTREFGVPRLPSEHQPVERPLDYLKALWPALLPVVRPFCDSPAEWPILFAIAVQESIFAAKDVIEPGLAVTVVMESAVPMSKVDLPEFHRTA
jgi:hypothetical protein